jgi:hypothetical protein
MLHSQAFKSINKNLDDEEIDVTSLICMGLLHCKQEKKSQEKALAFYNVVQDGGLAVGAFITANDKDLNPAIMKIGQLATINLYEWMKDISGIDNMYTSDELETLQDCWENLAEDFWKEDVFGA